jgi:hypothetical protein
VTLSAIRLGVGIGLLATCAGAIVAKAPGGDRVAVGPAARPIVPRHFGTLPPGAPLPSGARCAAKVRRAPENRPANVPYNETSGHSRQMPKGDWLGATTWRNVYFRRVNGAFTGTTDEILQWVSCKWGIDEDVTRARAAAESSWRQRWFGDEGHTVGILGVKCMVPGDAHRFTYPECYESTSYNADYATAFVRACYDNLFAQGHWFNNGIPARPADPAGDRRLWECVGLWFSGRFEAGNRAYISAVRLQYATEPWRRGGL